MRWFAVKTLFRTSAVGQAHRRDQHDIPGLAAIEESVVLFRAQHGKAALKKAEAEARRYAKKTRYVNRYGQRVVTEALDYLNAYEIDGTPGNEAEVFSAIEIARAREDPSKVIARKMGASADASTAHMFVAAAIAQELERR